MQLGILAFHEEGLFQEELSLPGVVFSECMKHSDLGGIGAGAW